MPAPNFQHFADAWDGRGDEYIGVAEKRALCALARFSLDVAHFRWSGIPHAAQDQLILAARGAVELGMVCSQLLLRDSRHQQHQG